MTPSRVLIASGLALLLLLGVGLGARWYLFGPNEIDSAALVPANTVAFASIPNAVSIVAGYQTSQLKTLVDSPNAQPLHDAMVNLIGNKNADLIQTFLPNLSGQSLIAVTHFDYDHPEQIGLVAAMRPKAGLGDFNAFVDKLKATWPDLVKQGKTGTGTVAGVDYQWIQGPGAPDKICVAQIRGWIVTSWGEASLQDWLERLQKKSSTSSLAEDVDYRKAIAAVGENPMTLVYVNCHACTDLLQKQMAKLNPSVGDYFAKKLDALGGAALASRFENGEIVDRFSFLIPRPAQLDAGMAPDPCPFETLKFTGPDTRFYWASSIDWQQYYKNLKDQSENVKDPSGAPAAVNPIANSLFSFLQTWVRGTTLDSQHNVVDALGPELSVQAEWTADGTYPEAGLFVKLKNPDDFKPTVAAIVDSVRKAYATSAVIKEFTSNGQNFAALEFVQASPINPTITEDGPYLGIFLTENQAVRSFQRDPNLGLLHNPDFNRQIGDKRNGAAQVFFLDSPRLLDRAYQTAMPYLSLAGMFNRDLAAMLKGKNLPPDLTWLAPMGTWSCVITPDEEGIQGYSASGIGNQGILLGGAANASVGLLQSMGWIPKQFAASLTPATPSTPAVALAPKASTPPDGAGTLAPTLVPSLPSGDGTIIPDASKPGQATIYITSESTILFETTPVATDQIGDFLKAKKATNQALKLVVKVDKDATPDALSTVMDAGASAGFGVLPYTYATGPNSTAPATNSDAATAPASAAPTPTSSSSIPGSTAPGPAAIGSPLPAALTPPQPATNVAPLTNSTSNAIAPNIQQTQTPATQ